MYSRHGNINGKHSMIFKIPSLSILLLNSCHISKSVKENIKGHTSVQQGPQTQYNNSSNTRQESSNEATVL